MRSLNLRDIGVKSIDFTIEEEKVHQIALSLIYVLLIYVLMSYILLIYMFTYTVEP